MIFGNAFLAKGDVTLRTNKRWIFLLLIDFKIQSPTVIGCGSDVTSVRAAARPHRNLQRLQIKRIERRTRHVMTTHAVQVRMLSAFMTESAGGNALAPFAEHRRVGDPHRGCQFRLEINFQCFWR